MSRGEFVEEGTQRLPQRARGPCAPLKADVISHFPILQLMSETCMSQAAFRSNRKKKPHRHSLWQQWLFELSSDLFLRNGHLLLGWL